MSVEKIYQLPGSIGKAIVQDSFNINVSASPVAAQITEAASPVTTPPATEEPQTTPAQ